MEVKLTNVFHRTGEALIKAFNGTGPRLIVEQGGQGSSKTFSVLQSCYNFLKYYPEPLRATFASYALPHLKGGVISDFDKILYSFGENLGKIKAAPQHPVYTLGKSEVNCYGIEGNIAYAHGPRRDLLYINEVNRRVSYEVFDQLFSRSGVTIVDFNPDREFFLHEKVLPFVPHVLIKSTFLDNAYLPEQERDNILMKKDNPIFANWWKVYGLGELGTFEGAIFQNWRYEEPGEVDQAFRELPSGYGLDYGFYPDPDAMTKVAIDEKRKKIYIKEMIYATNNKTSTLIEAIKLFYKQNELIIAESASPRTNEDLKDSSINIKKVNKTETVAEWLRKLMEYELIIDQESYNLAKELVNYTWNDKKAGIPNKGFDHCFEGNTLISTIKGQVKIKYIESGDLVLTSNGYKKVLHKFNNGLKKIFVYYIYISDICIELRCTPDHKIKTDKGWIQVSQLKAGVKIYLNNYSLIKPISYTLEKNTFQGELKGFILKYGNIITVKFRKGMKFITKIKTRIIIILQTLKLKKANYTQANTEKKGLLIILNGFKSFIMRVLQKLLNGIKVKLVNNGIRIIIIECQHPYILKRNINVGFVGINLNQHKPIQDFAQMPVSQNLEDIQELIMNKEFVSAGIRLRVANTQGKSFVATHVVQKIESKETADICVYDLMVNDTHEYFANGVLVHNCIDSFRYYFMMNTSLKPSQQKWRG